MSSSSKTFAPLRRDLDAIDKTSERISKLSNYLRLRSAEAAGIALVWSEACAAAAPDRQLPLLYLVNDVLRHNAGKDRDGCARYVAALGPLLPAAFATAARRARTLARAAVRGSTAAARGS